MSQKKGSHPSEAQDLNEPQRASLLAEDHPRYVAIVFLGVEPLDEVFERRVQHDHVDGLRCKDCIRLKKILREVDGIALSREVHF